MKGDVDMDGDRPWDSEDERILPRRGPSPARAAARRPRSPSTSRSRSRSANTRARLLEVARAQARGQNAAEPLPEPAAQAGPRMVCKDFRRGSCTRGDGCKFVHALAHRSEQKVHPSRALAHRSEQKARQWERVLTCAADMQLSRECVALVDALPGGKKMTLLKQLEDRRGELHRPSGWLATAARNELKKLGKTAVALDLDPKRYGETASRAEWLSLGRAQPRKHAAGLADEQSPPASPRRSRSRRRSASSSHSRGRRSSPVRRSSPRGRAHSAAPPSGLAPRGRAHSAGPPSGAAPLRAVLPKVRASSPVAGVSAADAPHAEPSVPPAGAPPQPRAEPPPVAKQAAPPPVAKQSAPPTVPKLPAPPPGAPQPPLKPPPRAAPAVPFDMDVQALANVIGTSVGHAVANLAATGLFAGQRAVLAAAPVEVVQEAAAASRQAPSAEPATPVKTEPPLEAESSAHDAEPAPTGDAAPEPSREEAPARVVKGRGAVERRMTSDEPGAQYDRELPAHPGVRTRPFYEDELCEECGDELGAVPRSPSAAVPRLRGADPYSVGVEGSGAHRLPDELGQRELRALQCRSAFGPRDYCMNDCGRLASSGGGYRGGVGLSANTTNAAVRTARAAVVSDSRQTRRDGAQALRYGDAKSDARRERLSDLADQQRRSEANLRNVDDARGTGRRDAAKGPPRSDSQRLDARGGSDAFRAGVDRDLPRDKLTRRADQHADTEKQLRAAAHAPRGSDRSREGSPPQKSKRPRRGRGKGARGSADARGINWDDI